MSRPRPPCGGGGHVSVSLGLGGGVRAEDRAGGGSSEPPPTIPRLGGPSTRSYPTPRLGAGGARSGPRRGKGAGCTRECPHPRSLGSQPGNSRPSPPRNCAGWTWVEDRSPFLHSLLLLRARAPSPPVPVGPLGGGGGGNPGPERGTIEGVDHPLGMAGGQRGASHAGGEGGANPNPRGAVASRSATGVPTAPRWTKAPRVGGGQRGIPFLSHGKGRDGRRGAPP